LNQFTENNKKTLETAVKQKTIYLFPNLLTTGALLCGFFAMIRSVQQDYSTAAIFIIFAAILDALDGRIARLFNAQSKFGEQYDSLSDMISFGAAPAVTAYLWGLSEFGRFGTVVSSLFCISTALRLARFNISIGTVNKKFFQGLPCPAAATWVASMIYTVEYEGIISSLRPAILPLIVILVAGLLMVSNIPYYSFKEVDPRRAIPFKILLLLAFIASFIYLSPHVTIFTTFTIYSLSGLFIWAVRFIRARKMKTFIRD